MDNRGKSFGQLLLGILLLSAGFVFLLYQYGWIGGASAGFGPEEFRDGRSYSRSSSTQQGDYSPPSYGVTSTKGRTETVTSSQLEQGLQSGLFVEKSPGVYYFRNRSDVMLKADGFGGGYSVIRR